MPTNRRHRIRSRVGGNELTDLAYRYFKWHGLVADPGCGWGNGRTVAEIRAFWQKHRVAIQARRREEGGKRLPEWKPCPPLPGELRQREIT